MARNLRLEYEGACYHVINRGNYRRDVFAPKGAAESFQECLFEVAQKTGWRLHAFVIMRNHFHLAVETPEPNLSVGMKWLQGTWAIRFNRYRGEVGRPFQGRYKALHVEPGEALAQVCHYIHLNPVRAKVLPIARVDEFLYSSLAWFGRKDRPQCLTAETVLSECGGLADTPAGWRSYHEYLGFMAEEEAKLREEKFGRMSRGWMLGSRGFKLALQKDLAEHGVDLEKAKFTGEKPGERWREEKGEEKLQLVARHLKIDLKKLPTQKSAPDKVTLAALLKVGTAVSNGWLAERLAMGSAANVSQFVRRFRLAHGPETPRFKRALSIVLT